MIFNLFYPDIKTSYTIEPSDDDYIEYLWEKKLKIKFNQDNIKLYDKDMILYNDIKHNLNKDDIDKDDFTIYLRDKYENKSLNTFYNEQIEIADILYNILYEYVQNHTKTDHVCAFRSTGSDILIY